MALFIPFQEIIEELVEIDLELTVTPLDDMYQDCGVAALLMSDKKTIIIDKDI